MKHHRVDPTTCSDCGHVVDDSECVGVPCRTSAEAARARIVAALRERAACIGIRAESYVDELRDTLIWAAGAVRTAAADIEAGRL